MRCLLLMIFSCAMFSSLAQIDRRKDVTYKTGSSSERHQLDVYYPQDTQKPKEVIIFFHGGSWTGGKKDTYKFLGKRLAKKGFVVVIANYRLAPEVKYAEMAEDCAEVVRWTAANIEQFGGDKNRIVVTGHSAGGHLAALISLHSQYAELQSNIYKTILIDPFGLDMVTYFNEYKNDYAEGRKKKVFTYNPNEWRNASPLYSIKPDFKIPVLTLVGGKTYPTILQSTAVFHDHMLQAGNNSKLITIEKKKHIGMITQLFFRKNPAYGTMTDFIRQEASIKR